MFLLLWSPSVPALEKVELNQNDVVAFVGGGDVAGAQYTGHLESLLVRAHPKLRCRNFGWEGDTVFAQPRDYNFPPLAEHLRKAGSTVIFVQFGRMEAFAQYEGFREHYEKLLKDLHLITSRIILVTPVPFERATPPLPDVSVRNSDAEKIAKAIRKIATEHALPVVDLYAALMKKKERLTDDGVQLTTKGQGIVARAFAAELGLKDLPEISDDGAWADEKQENLRKLIVAKNQHWFDYWRPQNWAFLGGDRIEQPSSRDHRDPKIRWFPEEIEKFKTLIEQKEKEISGIAEQQ